MIRFASGLFSLSAVRTVALHCLALPVLAASAEKSGAPEASEPNDADAAPKGEGKPDEAPPTDARAEDAPPEGAGEIQSGAKMRDIRRFSYPHHGTRSGRCGHPPARQGLARCHHPHPAKRNGDRGLLLHAQGLCEGEPDRYRLLHRVPIGDAGSRSCTT